MSYTRLDHSFDVATSDSRSLSRLLRKARFYERYGKRTLDITLIVFAAPVIVPLMLLMCLLSVLDGASPFYCQKRLGRNRKVFRLIKLRSMVPNGDAVLAGILAKDPVKAAYWSKHQKLRPDPRVTPFGRLLRKTSLDELPQLWNVLRGEMSLVGPRPMMPDQWSIYPGTDYASMRPGLTGLWQVSERSNSTFAARASYDSDYYETLSLKTDLRIILQTFAVVFACSGE